MNGRDGSEDEVDLPGDTASDGAQETTQGEAADEQSVGAQDPIMSQLRTLYDDVASEPLPENLLNLLKQLDEAERSR